MGLVVLLIFSMFAGAAFAGRVSAERNDGRWAAFAAALAAAAALLFVVAAWPVLSLVWSAVAAVQPVPPPGPVRFQ